MKHPRPIAERKNCWRSHRPRNWRMVSTSRGTTQSRASKWTKRGTRAQRGGTFLLDFAAMDRQQLDAYTISGRRAAGTTGIKWSTRDKASCFGPSLSRSSPAIVATTTDNPLPFSHPLSASVLGRLSRRSCSRTRSFSQDKARLVNSKSAGHTGRARAALLLSSC